MMLSSCFFLAILVSNLSNSINQIAGQTEAKYRKMDGQNHFHSCDFLMAKVNTPSKTNMMMVVHKYQNQGSFLMVTTLKMATRPCAEKMRRVMMALMVSMKAMVVLFWMDVVESAASRRLKNYEKFGKDF